MKRRRVNILADVLNAAGNGTKRTRIMQNANLSHGLLKKYLADAVRNAFLQSNSIGYEVTEKGRKFLDQYNQFHSEYSRVGSGLQSLMSQWEALERMCQECPDNDAEADAAAERKSFEKRILKSAGAKVLF